MTRYLLVSLLALTGQIFSLLLQFLIARRYGTVASVDAWIAAQAIPAVISTAAGSLGGQLVMPALIRAAEQEGKEGFRQASGEFLSLFALTGLAVSLPLVLAAEAIIGWTVPGLGEEAKDMAGWFLRVSAAGLPAGIVFVFFAQAAQTRERFLIAPVVSVLMLAGQFGAFLAAPTGRELHWVISAQALTAWLGLPLIAFLGLDWKPAPRLRPGNAAMSLIRRSVPALVIVASVRINHAVDNYFASGLPEGHLAALGYAVRSTAILQAAVAAPIMSVVFAGLAKSAARGEWDQFASDAGLAARRSLFISMMLAVLMAGLGARISVLFLGWGAPFDGISRLAWCLVVLSGITAFAAWGSLLARVCFAASLDRLAVVYLGIIPVIFNLVMDWLLVEPFGVIGLAAVTSLNAVLGLPLLERTLRKKGRIAGGFYLPFFRLVLCAGITGAALWFCPPVIADGTLTLTAEIILLGITGAVLFLILAGLLGDDTPRYLVDRFRRKFSGEELATAEAATP